MVARIVYYSLRTSVHNYFDVLLESWTVMVPASWITSATNKKNLSPWGYALTVDTG